MLGNSTMKLKQIGDFIIHITHNVATFWAFQLTKQKEKQYLIIAFDSLKDCKSTQRSNSFLLDYEGRFLAAHVSNKYGTTR